jgi:uncharacterized protein (DUF924 family)
VAPIPDVIHGRLFPEGVLLPPRLRETHGVQREILEFWLGPEAGRTAPEESITRQWFGGGAALDDTLRERFGEAVEQALAGELDGWSATPTGRVALVILLDQFTRNLFRGQGRAFAGDARALSLAVAAVEAGEDAELAPAERYFLYMPFMHAEDAAAQARSVELFEALVRDAPGLDGRSWARRHQVVVDRFGRFPSRNAALGRETTPEERAFLEEAPTGF